MFALSNSVCTLPLLVLTLSARSPYSTYGMGIGKRGVKEPATKNFLACTFIVSGGKEFMNSEDWAGITFPHRPVLEVRRQELCATKLKGINPGSRVQSLASWLHDVFTFPVKASAVGETLLNLWCDVATIREGCTP